MKVLWGRAAWDDFRDWYGSDAQAFEKIFQLVAGIQRDPFRGVGQPEPLEGKTFQGWWSRRINKRDRLIYPVAGKDDDQTLEIWACRGHYG